MSPAGRSGPIVSLHFSPATLLEHRSIIKTSFVETTFVADAAKTLVRRPTSATAQNRKTRISYPRYVKFPNEIKPVFFSKIFKWLARGRTSRLFIVQTDEEETQDQIAALTKFITINRTSEGSKRLKGAKTLIG